MSHYSDINYDDFFQTTAKLLRKNLPDELRQFKTSRPTNSGWIVVSTLAVKFLHKKQEFCEKAPVWFRLVQVRYPQFKNSQYELHLSSHSTHHAEYFEVGPHVTSAFYYKTKFGDSDAWLEALATYVELIQEQLSKQVVIGPWGEKWVWIAESLDKESLTPEILSILHAQFIQATYKPISLAFKAIGR